MVRIAVAGCTGKSGSSIMDTILIADGAAEAAKRTVRQRNG